MKRTGSDETLSCSFCHKRQEVVGKLISSPSEYPRAYICDECVMVCHSILQNDGIVPAATNPTQIVLEPEVAKVFTDSDSVNDALAELILIARRIKNPGP